MRRNGYSFLATDPSGHAKSVRVRTHGDESAARLLLESNGYTNIRSKPRGSHTVDPAALAGAIDFLGLQWPVQIKRNGRYGSQEGSWRMRFRSPGSDNAPPALAEEGSQHHLITLKSYLTPDQASRTLWHELAHAMQAEREVAAAGAVTPPEVSKAWTTSAARGAGVAYLQKPIEVEARSYEVLAETDPLAR